MSMLLSIKTSSILAASLMACLGVAIAAKPEILGAQFSRYQTWYGVSSLPSSDTINDGENKCQVNNKDFWCDVKKIKLTHSTDSGGSSTSPKSHVYKINARRFDLTLPIVVVHDEKKIEINRLFDATTTTGQFLVTFNSGIVIPARQGCSWIREGTYSMCEIHEVDEKKHPIHELENEENIFDSKILMHEFSNHQLVKKENSEEIRTSPQKQYLIEFISKKHHRYVEGFQQQQNLYVRPTSGSDVPFQFNTISPFVYEENTKVGFQFSNK